MPDYQLLIFDWDGTLVDSIDRIVESMHRAADVCGLPQLSDEAIRGIIGLGLPEAIQTLYPDLREPALIERFREGYGEHYLSLENQPSALFPGVAESLESRPKPWMRERKGLASASVAKAASSLRWRRKLMMSRQLMPKAASPACNARSMPPSTVAKGTPRAVWVWGSKKISACTT